MMDQDNRPRYPVMIPMSAPNRMTGIGEIFFFLIRYTLSAKIAIERMNLFQWIVVSGKNTVLPTEISAVPIKPTTVGRRPDITP